IGMCIGLDSTATEDGNKWLLINPAYSITHPPKPKDRFDFESRRWEDPTENYQGYKLGKSFYVKPSDVSLKNRDREYE
ncbi:MAG: hypothetical protein AAFY76_14470, partial [Cyanobacteria bacterium J06649_11]